VTNFGTIAAALSYGSGVFIGGGGGGGIVLNGSETVTGSSITGGSYGVRILGGDGTVVNFGTIAATTAVSLSGSHVFNGSSGAPGALIHGSNVGVASTTNITNYGTILGDASFGVDGGTGGAITNAVTGLIAGANGIRTAATLVSNAGTIHATSYFGGGYGGGYGVHLFATDVRVLNTGLIAGASQGIGVYGTGTVTNFGTINGGYGTALLFGAGNDRLVVGPGAAFGGNVNGNVGSDVLELADGAGPGTLTGLGAKYLNFESLMFDPDAAWRVTLSTPAAFTGTVFGFSTDDSLDLTGVAFDPNATATLLANNVLKISANGSNFTMQFDPGQSFAGQDFRLSQDGAGGTLVTLTPAPRAARDFNNDGRSDILWFHTSGLAFIWEMDGFTPIETGLAGIVPAGWRISDTGDFGGDRREDILWRHDTGSVVIWEMDGLTPINTGVVGFADPGWDIAAAADFGGDGKDDILWRHDNGDVVIWEMDGLTPISAGVVGFADPTWHIDGTGDFGGDGRDDILWRHDNGDVVIWEMDGLTPISAGLVSSVDPSWQIAGTGDFGGDGRSDILWRHDDGGVVIWEMNGLTPISVGFVGAADNNWQIRDTGDYNGDQRSDILWHHTSGLVLEWQMDGSTIIAQGLVVDPGWQIVGSPNASTAPAAADTAFGFADIAGETAAQASAASVDAVDGGGEAVAAWAAGVAPLYDPAGTLYG
jgi:hypothetical protein